MHGISEQQILEWIDQCDNQLKKLQSAKDFIHREYYKRDSISYHVEENLQDNFGQKIFEHKVKLELLWRMLEQLKTDDVIVMFDHLFPDTVVNQLPENLRKEFFDFVYEM